MENNVGFRSDELELESNPANRVEPFNEKDKPRGTADVDALQRSLFVFSVNNRFRQACLKTVQHPKFIVLMLCIIVLNCASIATQGSTTVEHSAALQQAVAVSDYFFVAAFTLELVIKVIAYGFLFAGGQSYLRNRWNILDFCVVVLGYLNYVQGVSDYSYLRSLRLLSTFRAVSVLKGLRVMVISLFASLPSLADVFLLLLFLIHIFAVVFLYFFSGKLRQRCFDPPLSYFGPNVARSPQLCAFNNSEHDYGNTVHDILCSTSIASGSKCSDAFQCCGVEQSQSFKNGVVRFENIALSWANVLLLLSAEGWTDTMYAIGDAVSKWNYILFIALEVVGTLFVIHLITAVLYIRFEQTKSEELKKYQRASEMIYTHRNASQVALSQSRPGSPPAVGSRSHRGSAPMESLSARPVRGDVPALYAADSGESNKSPAALALMNSNEAGSSEPETRYAMFSSRSAKPMPSRQGRCGRCYGPRIAVFHLVDNTRFMIFMACVAFVNTFMLALQHQGMSTVLSEIITYSTMACTGLFFVEMLLKMFAFGVRGYLHDSFNIFDGIIVTATFVESLITFHTGSLAALQALRLLRFQFLQSWSSMQNLLLTILDTLVDLLYFSILLAIFIFIYAVAGMQIFKYKMSGRSNFDNFGQAVLTVFQIMTPENWDSVLEDGVQGAGWQGGAFLFTNFIFGNYIMLNLFLAILVSNFGKSTERKLQYEAEKLEHDKLERSQRDDFDSPDDDLLEDSEIEESKFVGEGREPSVSRKRKRKLRPGSSKSRMAQPKEKTRWQAFADKFCCYFRGDSEEIVPEEMLEKPEPREFLGTFPILHHETRTYFSRKHAQINPAHLKHTSLCCLSSTNPIRLAASKFVQHRAFDNFLLFCIVCNCILLSMDSPTLDPNSLVGRVVSYGDYIIIGVFSFELVMKSIVTGFMMHKGSYLRSKWNCLDLFILLTSVIATAFPSALGRFPRAFRALRALRPLRIISNFDDTRAVLGAILQSFWSIFNIILFGCLIFLILSIIGVQQFAGRLSHCYVPPSTTPNDTVLSWNISTCEASGGIWDTPHDMGNFDNIGAGFLFLFELTTEENWPSFMHAAMDATPYGLPSIENASPWAALYFIGAMMIVDFFYKNLFVGAIVDAYQEHYTSFNSGAGDLSPAHIKWIRIYRNILSHVPRFQPDKPPLLKQRSILNTAHIGIGVGVGDAWGNRPTNDRDINIPCCTVCFTCEEDGMCCHQNCAKWTDCCHACGMRCNDACMGPSKIWSRVRVFAYHLCTNRKFDDFVIGVIIFNTLVISASYYDEATWYERLLLSMNDACTWFYVLEAALKLTAFGYTQYFSIRWNQLDFLVVLTSLVDFLSLSLKMFSVDAPGLNPLMFRAFRVLRFFKLLDRFQALRELVLTLRFSLPQAYHIAFLLMVLFFVYAVAGMALFGSVKQGNYLDSYGNFEDFPTAVVTLFRMTTGENWNGIMRDCMIQEPFCTINVNCGSASQAIVFFVSFMLLAQFLLLNIITAVVLKNFENEFEEGESAALEDSVPIISVRDITNFGKIWLKFSVTETLSVKLLPALLYELMALEGTNEEHGNVDAGDPHLGVHSMKSRSSESHHDGSLRSGDYHSLKEAPSPSVGRNPRFKRNSSLPNQPPTVNEHSTALEKEPQAIMSENEINELVEELNIPVNPQRKTVHYVDVLYQLSLRKFRMVVVMTDTIPMDHDMVHMAKTQALRQFPELKLHTQFAEAKKPHELLQQQRAKEAGQAPNNTINGTFNGTFNGPISPVAIRVVAPGIVQSPVHVLSLGMNGAPTRTSTQVTALNRGDAKAVDAVDRLEDEPIVVKRASLSSSIELDSLDTRTLKP